MRSPTSEEREVTVTGHDPFAAVLAAIADGDAVTAARRIDEFLATMPASASARLRAQARRVAATAHRLAGDLVTAGQHVRAAQVLAADTVVRVEVELEVGDIARAGGHLDAAVAAYDAASALAAAAAVPEPLRWQVELRLALALAACGEHDRAADRMSAMAATLPTVTVEQLAADVPPAQLALLAAFQALTDGDVDGASASLETAAREARHAEDTPAYVAAKLALSQLLDERGERAGAYGMLATAWATLRAAGWGQLAQVALEPPMRELQERWGPEAFDAVRHEFAARHGTTRT